MPVHRRNRSLAMPGTPPTARRARPTAPHHRPTARPRRPTARRVRHTGEAGVVAVWNVAHGQSWGAFAGAQQPRRVKIWVDSGASHYQHHASPLWIPASAVLCSMRLTPCFLPLRIAARRVRPTRQRPRPTAPRHRHTARRARHTGEATFAWEPGHTLCVGLTRFLKAV